MAKTPYPARFRLSRAVAIRFNMTRFEIQWPPRRVQTRPTGGAYVGIGWKVRGRGSRVTGWNLTDDQAAPIMEFLEGEFVVLDSDL